MNGSVLGLALVSVLLSSMSQILLKAGMSTERVQQSLTPASTATEKGLAIAGSPMVALGFACFGLSALVWIFVLSRIPVSLAYPFVALGIVATVTAGGLILGEPIPLQRIAGVAAITAGVLLVASS
jgi:multidrug transporter EmrE-like cation transporter